MSKVVLEIDVDCAKCVVEEFKRMMQECAVGECHYRNDVRDFYRKRKERLTVVLAQFKGVRRQ